MPTILKRFTVYTSPAGKLKDPIVHVASIENPSVTFCGMETATMTKEPGDKWYQLPPPRLSCRTCQTKIKKVWPIRGAFYKWDR